MRYYIYNINGHCFDVCSTMMDAVEVMDRVIAEYNEAGYSGAEVFVSTSVDPWVVGAEPVEKPWKKSPYYRAGGTY